MTYKEIFFLRKVIKRYQFNPQSDITAYELALLMPLLVPNGWKTLEILGEQIGKLPPEVKRHINVIEE